MFWIAEEQILTWLGLLGKIDNWCIGISYFGCTHTYTEAASCRAEIGSGKHQIPKPHPQICQGLWVTSCKQKQGEREAIVLHHIAVAQAPPHHHFRLVLFQGLLIFIRAILLCLHFSIMLAGLLPSCFNRMQTSWNQILLAKLHQTPSATQYLSPHSC